MRTSYQLNPAVAALRKRARETGTPLFGAFELTSRCNLDCKMCYVHTMDVKEALRTELSTDQWLSIMDAAYDNGMLFALLTGGECLLRKDFKEIYLHLFNKGVFISVNTNAVLINEEYADFFKKHMPERIQVTLYGSSNDGYEKVTGFRKYDETIRALKLLKERGLPVEVAVTPSTWLKDDYKNILLCIKDLGLPYKVNAALIEPREGVDRDSSYLTDEEQIELLRQRREVSNTEIVIPEQEAPVPGCSDGVCVKGMPCNAGTIRFVIDGKGNMMPCMAVPEVSISALENDFVTCWNLIHKKMEDVLQPAECQNCLYKKHCPVCPAVRYDGLYSGKCDSRLCQLQVKKYRAGVIKI